MSYQKLATDILEQVGGKANVSNLTHCATRLRFVLKDESKANTEALKKMQGVMGVATGGGQYQVIIGSDVSHVYAPIIEMCGLGEGGHREKSNKSIPARFIGMISAIFTPILPAITASGMLKAVLALCVAFKWVDTSAQAYQIINFMADAGFYFLPILLANSAAKQFRCNAYLAMMIGGILLHPTFVNMVATAKETGEAIRFLMIPVYNANYASSVVPIILSVWFMSYVEKAADKISPKMIKYFTVPLITVLVTGVVSLTVLGPVGHIIGNVIADAITFMERTCSWLVPMILGGIFPLLVMTGTHYGIIPIGANNIMTLGYDSMIGPGNLASNIAQGGAALAVGMKTKDSNVKQLALSSGVTAVCGITEPALFGVNIRYKTPLYAAMTGGAAGGLFIGLFNVRRFASGSPGIMTLPVYIGEAGLSNLLYACIGSAIAFGIAFVVSYILFKEEAVSIESEPKAAANSSMLKEGTVSISAPVDGEVIALEEVNDPAFSAGSMGKGAAIIPSDGHFVSPVNGEVVMVFDTKHAIGIKSDDGVEVLIHVGMDTVRLDGKPFTVLVKQGDQVKVGTPILDADLESIKAAGLDIVTPVIITNTLDFGDVISVPNGQIKAAAPFLKGVR